MSEGRFTFIELEGLMRRARQNGQEGVAFHLAMARDVLMEEEFGSIFRRHPALVERAVSAPTTIQKKDTP